MERLPSRQSAPNNISLYPARGQDAANAKERKSGDWLDGGSGYQGVSRSLFDTMSGPGGANGALIFV
jgi:hypothetical protein